MPKRSYKQSTIPDYQHPDEKPPKSIVVPPDTYLQDTTKLPPSALLTMHGISPKYLIHEYMKVVNQDDDLTNKLKALTPLMREIGIDTSPKDDPSSKITNNIFVMPAEITKKFNLTPISTEPSPDTQLQSHDEIDDLVVSLPDTPQPTIHDI